VVAGLAAAVDLNVERRGVLVDVERQPRDDRAGLAVLDVLHRDGVVGARGADHRREQCVKKYMKQ
jgi:hypothetical protein